METMESQSNAKMFLIFVFQVVFVAVVDSTQIKGVPASKLSFYDPGKDFTCLDGTVTVPFSYVNDDYCDCPDGSDEPGTSACPNGQFTCKNLGHKQVVIQSSRVNDAVCDCCDGSDEYDGGATCANICEETGRAERERLAQERLVAQQGFEIKTEYMEKGKAKRMEIQTKTEELRIQLDEQKAKLDELKAAKERAETLEKEAKEEQDKVFDELDKIKAEEEEAKTLDEAFGKLDIDSNGVISVDEFVSSSHTKKELTEDEAKEKLGQDEIDKAKLNELWPTIKDLYMAEPEKAVEETKEPNTDETVAPKDDSEEAKVPDFSNEERNDDADDSDDEDEEDDKDTADEKSAEPLPPPPEDKSSKDSSREYNEETKRLISIADQARKEFNEIDTQIKNIERDVSHNEKLLSIDFGPDNEFFALHGECFEYTDREYIYKLCPFDRASQSSKSGGSDTSLGTWGHWHGSPNKYSKMKYSDGLSCWNGPNRSADISMKCGSSNAIISVSEPNRCEYVMEFTTPALCKDPAHTNHFQHEEL